MIPIGDTSLGTTSLALGWTILCAILPGIFLVSWTALVLSLMGHRRPMLRYGVALAGLLLAVLLPVLQFAQLSREVATENQLEEATIQVIAQKLQAGPSSPSEMSLPRRMVFGLQFFASSYFPWILTAWGIGSTLLCLRILGGWLHLLRRIHNEAVPGGRELQLLLDSLRERMGVRRRVRLVLSKQLSLPATVGWLEPLILIPTELVSRLDTVHFESILSHELAHVRRADYLLNLIQLLMEALFFWNPAVWLASHQVRSERESCCDAEAVKTNGSALRYAEALASLERLRQPAGNLVVALCGTNLVVRLRRLLELQRRGADGMNPALTAAIVMMLMGVTIFGLGSVWIAAKQRKASQDFEGWRAIYSTHAIFVALQGRAPSIEPEITPMLRLARDQRWLMALVAGLRSQEAQTREEAAWLLGLMGDPRAVPYLQPLQNDEYPAVRQSVTEALAKLR